MYSHSTFSKTAQCLILCGCANLFIVCCVATNALAAACNDGIDNDGDGLVDFGWWYSDDPGCDSPEDSDEANPFPAAPSNLRAAETTSESVLLAWDDNSPDETGFDIHRSAGDDPNFYSTMGTPANDRDVLNAPVYASTQYRYKVRSSLTLPNGHTAYSAFSNVVNTTSLSVTGTECSDGIDNDQDGQVDFPNDTGCTSLHDNVENDRLDAQGWTVLQPNPETQLIFVSSSQGDDSRCIAYPAATIPNLNAPSLSEPPCKTILKGQSLLRNGYPDWLLLKSGDTWNFDPLNERANRFGYWNLSGRSELEPLVIQSYGVGERPLILTGTYSGFEGYGVPSGTAHLFIRDLNFFPDAYDGTNGTPTGIGFLGYFRDVTVENVMVRGYFLGMYFQGYPEGYYPHDVRLRRSSVVDAYRVGGSPHSGGLFVGGVDGMRIDESLFDHNGWSETVPGAIATVFRHNIYLHSVSANVIATGNITARAAASGFRPCNFACENNLVLQNPVNLPGDPVNTKYLRNNVVLDSHDIGTDPRGWGIVGGVVPGAKVAGNIVAHQQTGTGNTSGLDLTVVKDVTIEQNVVYDWTDNSRVLPVPEPANGGGMGLSLKGDPIANIRVVDNVLQQPDPARGGMVMAYFLPQINPAIVHLSGNRYFTTNALSWPFNRVFWVPPPPYFEYATKERWFTETGDPSSWEQVAFTDPNRSVASYMAHLRLIGFPTNQPATLDGFLADARLQSRTNWRPELLAAQVNNYIREGFDRPMVGGGFTPTSSAASSSSSGGVSSASASFTPHSSLATTSSASSVATSSSVQVSSEPSSGSSSSSAGPVPPSSIVAIVTVAKTTEGSSRVGKIVIMRAGKLSKALNVNYTISGRARNGRDYRRISNRVTIARNKKSVTIRIEALRDRLDEPVEEVILTFTGNSQYAVLGNSQVRVEIVNRPRR